MTYRIGIVGCGRMASAMASAIGRTANMRVAAVASDTGDQARAQAFATAFGVAATSPDLPGLLARDDLDLVYIANRTGRHAATANAALDAGKNVLCEKPFATGHAEGLTVRDAARRSGRLFMEALWTPLLPAFVRAQALKQMHFPEGAVHLAASFGYPASRASNPGLYEGKGGGVLLDRAVYPLSLALSMMGPVRDIQAYILHGDGVDEHASLQLLHEQGGHSQVAVSFRTLLDNRAVISGQRGSLELRAPLVGSEAVTLRLAGSPRPAAVQLAPRSSLRENLRSQPLLRRVSRALVDGRTEHHTFGADQYLPLLAHVAGLLATGKLESDVVPLDHSLDVLRIIDAARDVAAATLADTARS